MSGFPNTLLVGNPLAASSNTQAFSRVFAYFDEFILQRVLTQNLATIGIDAVAAGADPTGQKDSTAALQTILSSTGVLFLRTGTYLVSSPLSVTGTSTKPIIIYSDGQATIQMTAGSNCNALTVNTAAALMVRNINFQGKPGSLSAIFATTVTMMWVDKCVFGSWANSILITSTNQTRAFIQNCEFDIAGTADISYSGFTFVIINSCYFAFAQLNPVQGDYQASNNVGLNYLQELTPSPQAIIKQTIANSVPSGSTVTLTFDSPVVNQQGVWNNSFQTRFTAPVIGLYLAICNMGLVGGNVGQFTDLQVHVNGSFAGFISSGFQSATALNVSGLLLLNPSDYVEYKVFQNGGSSLGTNTGETQGTLFYLGTP